MARAMNDSGIEWIGEIPEYWTISRYKAICKIESGYPFDSSLFSNFEGFPIIRIRDITSGIIETYYQGEFSENYVVTKGDLLVGMDGDFNIRWWDNVDALLNQRCCRIIDKPGLHRRFLYYTLPFLLDIIHKLTYSTTVKHLSTNDILNSYLVYPSEDAQNSIVNYLDHKCSLIDSIIEKQKAVIEKLKLYKQSIITEAVTKGLDPTVKMKPSGIDWIGEIPEVWEIAKLKYFASLRSGITLGKKYDSGSELLEYPYLRVANVQFGHIDLSDVTTILTTNEDAQKYLLQVGEVLMTEGGDRDKLGRGCIWQGEIDNCLHQNHIFAIRTDAEKLNAYYFYYITASDVGRNYFDITAKKTTNLASTNSTTILDFAFPIPPIKEQNLIIKNLA
jgi:type I restriction enzyme S subunit